MTACGRHCRAAGASASHGAAAAAGPRPAASHRPTRRAPARTGLALPRPGRDGCARLHRPHRTSTCAHRPRTPGAHCPPCRRRRRGAHRAAGGTLAPGGLSLYASPARRLPRLRPSRVRREAPRRRPAPPTLRPSRPSLASMPLAPPLPPSFSARREGRAGGLVCGSRRLLGPRGRAPPPPPRPRPPWARCRPQAAETARRGGRCPFVVWPSPACEGTRAETNLFARAKTVVTVTCPMDSEFKISGAWGQQFLHREGQNPKFRNSAGFRPQARPPGKANPGPNSGG